MSSFKAVALFAAVILVMYACSDVFSIDFTKKESVVKIKERLETEIPADASIVGISFSSTADFTSDKEIAVVDYYPAGENDPVGKNVSLGKADPRDTKASFGAKEIKPENGIKLADIDFSVIPDYVQQGIDIMTADSVGLHFSGIGLYTIKIDKKSLKPVHKFSLESKGDSKTTTKNGRLATETEYYSLDFEARDGQVVLLN